MTSRPGKKTRPIVTSSSDGRRPLTLNSSFPSILRSVRVSPPCPIVFHTTSSNRLEPYAAVQNVMQERTYSTYRTAVSHGHCFSSTRTTRASAFPDFSTSAHASANALNNTAGNFLSEAISRLPRPFPPFRFIIRYGDDHCEPRAVRASLAFVEFSFSIRSQDRDEPDRICHRGVRTTPYTCLLLFPPGHYFISPFSAVVFLEMTFRDPSHRFPAISRRKAHRARVARVRPDVPLDNLRRNRVGRPADVIRKRHV